MKFLDDLYYGNIRPADREFVRNSKFDKALKVCYNCETELNKMENKEMVDLVTKLIVAHNELMEITSLENFKIGFRLGVRMMCDTLIDKNDMFKEITD